MKNTINILLFILLLFIYGNLFSDTSFMHLRYSIPPIETILSDENIEIYLKAGKLLLSVDSLNINTTFYLEQDPGKFIDHYMIYNKPKGSPPIFLDHYKEALVLIHSDITHIITFNPDPFLFSYPTSNQDIQKADKWITIDKTNNILYLYEHGLLSVKFNVATGQSPEYTPEGIFHIKNKTKLPEGDDSPFGLAWIGLSVPYASDLRDPPEDKRAPDGQKYGIHGTNEPHSIGHHATAGCIRLNNSDVLILYDLLEIDTPVWIRP